MHLLPEGVVAPSSQVVHAQQTRALTAALLLVAPFAALPALHASEKTNPPPQKWNPGHHVHTPVVITLYDRTLYLARQRGISH
jgi:hypothetical protein